MYQECKKEMVGMKF